MAAVTVLDFLRSIFRQSDDVEPSPNAVKADELVVGDVYLYLEPPQDAAEARRVVYRGYFPDADDEDESDHVFDYEDGIPDEDGRTFVGEMESDDIQDAIYPVPSPTR
jgi:hypothetical protein